MLKFFIGVLGFILYLIVFHDFLEPLINKNYKEFF